MVLIQSIEGHQHIKILCLVERPNILPVPTPVQKKNLGAKNGGWNISVFK